jgi:hypothetical protein
MQKHAKAQHLVFADPSELGGTDGGVGWGGGGGGGLQRLALGPARSDMIGVRVTRMP